MAGPVRPLRFRVQGMDCSEEVALIESELGPLVGGADQLQFNLVEQQLTVLPQEPIDPQEIIDRLASLRLKAQLLEDQQPPTRVALQWPRRQMVLTAISGVCWLAGVVLHAWLAPTSLGKEAPRWIWQGLPLPWPVAVFYLLAVLGGLAPLAPKVWLSLRHLRPDMHLLMSVAVTGALLIGEWFEAASVTFLFALSLTLEAWSVARARRAVASLVEMVPPEAEIVTDGTTQIVPAEQVKPGQVFLVRPGQRIPLDGQVVEGQSEVNQAPITGESVPVPKEPGDEVFAGSVNGQGMLRVRCTVPSNQSTLAQVAHLIAQAQSRRSEVEQWVDRFARRYTPAVMSTALVFPLLGRLVLGLPWQEAIYRALVLLVIACPCALVISTPVTIVAALTAAARRGVLVKAGRYLEAAASLRAVALDKTGTLTVGRLRVVEVIPWNRTDKHQLLRLAAALESGSTHPLAQAVVQYAREQGVDNWPEPTDYENLPGRGVTARLDGRLYWLGSHRLLEERIDESPELHRKLEQLASQGHTVVALGSNGQLLGLITLADQPRPEAAQVVRQLRSLGVEHVVMLTGDNQPTAQAIARQIELHEFYAELLPQDKVKKLEELLARYGQVAMVGDGVNDAPALALATLGIAMGAVGSDLAIEAADVALMGDRLERLPWLVALARRAVRVIRFNIAFALGVKGLFVVLALAGYSSLWLAIAADVGASLLVITNALRLLSGKVALPD